MESSNQTYFGSISTLQDALLILEGIRRKILPQVKRRLNDVERQQITAGSIFAWNETEVGMKRWTDGKNWSASKVKGPFLLYREHDHQRAEKPDGLVKQSFTLTTKNNAKLHLIAYYHSRDRLSGTLCGKIPSQDPLLLKCQLDPSEYSDEFFSYHLDDWNLLAPRHRQISFLRGNLPVPTLTDPVHPNSGMPLTSAAAIPSYPYNEQAYQQPPVVYYPPTSPYGYHHGQQFVAPHNPYHHADHPEMYSYQNNSQIRSASPPFQNQFLLKHTLQPSGTSARMQMRYPSFDPQNSPKVINDHKRIRPDYGSAELIPRTSIPVVDARVQTKINQSPYYSNPLAARQALNQPFPRNDKALSFPSIESKFGTDEPDNGCKGKKRERENSTSSSSSSESL